MKISEIFGSLTFSEKVMREKLSAQSFRQMKNVLEGKEPLSKELADRVAHALKEWALENNVTHYTHWFHPMTGSTAEKHDSFLQYDSYGNTIERFSASELIQGEPDASSFPSGGTRTTFEARGYSAWDPKSPCFIAEGEKTNTLCIPSVFFSYNGDSLDKKSVLLKSIKVLEQSTKKLLKAIGYNVPDSITITTGPEQEYYLIREELYKKREDLVITGRTLFGASPLKGQKMDDHYFGSINDDVKAFMEDVEMELYKLGVPCKTRHNEVAPCQYEIAPIYEELNIAADHNQLVMMVLKKKAKQHGFALLLHEKPFKGLNGSGKHNNWSIAGSDGTNYFSPGKTKEDFFRFIVFLTGFIAAINKHEKYIRASISSAANDHRLGGNEAPPSIVSVFTGHDLGEILENLKNGKFVEPSGMGTIDAGVSHLPKIEKHTTDRNRTSTVAFTGNKFEFRALGSSNALGFHNTVINGAVAESFEVLAEEIEKAKKENSNLEEATLQAISKILKENFKIVFNGNCYSKEWEIEAKKRGLSNLKSTPEALKVTLGDKKESAFLLEKGILNDRELEARYHVKMEQYCTILEIEAKAMLKMVKKYIKSSVIAQLKELEQVSSKFADKYKSLFNDLEEKELHLINELNNLEEIENEEKKAFYIVSNIIPAMDSLRDTIDSLEEETNKQYWKLPDYDNLLVL